MTWIMGGALRKLTSSELLRSYYSGERDFHDVDLSGLSLHDAHLMDAKFGGAQFVDARLHNALLWRSDFTDAKLCFLRADNASFDDADLSGADLRHSLLRDARFSRARLIGADLAEAVLDSATLMTADLSGARLTNTSLLHADLSHATLTNVSLLNANLDVANLSSANLGGANLGGAVLRGAVLDNTILDGATLGRTCLSGLDVSNFCDASDVRHDSPSQIDWYTVAKSYRHPRLKQFMIDCGVPALVAEYMIDCVRALGEVNIRAMLRSTFISYGGPDEVFARKLYDALKAAGVVTFFFPETAKLGERLHREMYRGVNEYDRILLVCSRASLTRPGVLNEIEETFAREAKMGGATYLLPITLDDFVFTDWKKSHEHLAERLLQRVVADFRGVDTDDAKFRAALARVIDALKVKPVPSSLPPVGAGVGGGTP